MKKVQFCAVVVLALCAHGVGATELTIPMGEVQRQLAEKAEQAVARKLQQCQDQEKVQEQEQHKGQEAPQFPVRIAEEQEPAQGIPLVFGGAHWAAP
ncbi:hypothetical protein [Microbulbifer sp. SAOS-129_SWC]|uniref:hypothetical protein n=1 Tax=Microbulbifer sp. SAOS-129_SWC TaxID=3145235 RepID=UPI0032165B51